MRTFRSYRALVATMLFSGSLAADATAGIVLDLGGFHRDSGLDVIYAEERLTIAWPLTGRDIGHFALDLRPGKPLIASLSVGTQGEIPRPLLRGVDPVAFVTVGERRKPGGEPPGRSVFNVFFDSPAQRPHQAHRSKLDLKRVRVRSEGHRVTVAVGDLAIGPFAGEWQFTFYRGAPLVHAEAVVKTRADRTAFLYDSGLAIDSPGTRRFRWVDTEGEGQRSDTEETAGDRQLSVRYRTLALETEHGSVACFPPPHQYFFPRDLTENLETVWYGRDHRRLDPRFGFGIRQAERGGGAFVPWFNAPPDSSQRLGVFYLIHRGTGEAAIKEALRYTNGDRFPELPGYHTFTSHWHMAIAMEALKQKAEGKGRSTPDFVRMFKDMGVEMVHLAEFHGDGHPRDPGPVRLREVQAMFDECRRLSDSKLLLMPGEEANVYLGLPGPGRHPGHWLCFFPRPVYWTMKRAPGQPFAEQDPTFGKVYHVGDRADMLRLIEEEEGLAWTAHPRIKASNWTPDIYRREDFYLSDRWLGAAWKAMPADLSHDRLGRRALDLLDDMANWGQRKYAPGEVDVFKIDHTHELYGHMNVNYVKLDRIPGFDEGWKPVLDSLRSGRFFVTTGEVLIPEFTVDGVGSGGELVLRRGTKSRLRSSLRWTFPMRFVEVVSGDGDKVDRQRIDLAETDAFGQKELLLDVDLSGRKWVRLEAWDIACNGAFTQPVWLVSTKE